MPSLKGNEVQVPRASRYAASLVKNAPEKAEYWFSVLTFCYGLLLIANENLFAMRFWSYQQMGNFMSQPKWSICFMVGGALLGVSNYLFAHVFIGDKSPPYNSRLIYLSYWGRSIALVILFFLWLSVAGTLGYTSEHGVNTAGLVYSFFAAFCGTRFWALWTSY
jgi:hypothetical protein